MAAQELRPMGVGDIVDVAFRLYRRRFLTFLLIALLVYVPYALLIALVRTSTTAPLPGGSVMGAVLAFGALAIFILVLMPLCSAALVHNISASYLGENISAGQSYSRAAPRLLAMLGTQFLAGLVILLGYILLIVPGIIFSLWFLVIAPVVILEGTAGSSALGRSRELMRGNLGKGFALGFVVAILSSIIAWGLNRLVGLVPWPHIAIGVFVRNVLPALILPIQTAPWILLYYDLRIRKEAFDLEMLAEALGQPTSGEPATT